MEKEFITFCTSLGLMPSDYQTNYICFRYYKGGYWGCILNLETGKIYCNGLCFDKFKQFKIYATKLLKKEKKIIIKNKLKNLNKDFI